MAKNTALQKIESHEKLCRIMQNETNRKIDGLKAQMCRNEKDGTCIFWKSKLLVYT